ncbi:MAG TPA: hypothetical protein VMW93_00225 [bacterium]|nr:hypothetical protein [bacterium]
MQAKLYVYAAGAWLVLAVLAVLNGILRNYTYGPLIGEQAAHVLSSLILVGVVLAVAYVFLRLVRLDYGLADLLAVGAGWVALTVAFEFLFGHYVAGHPWSRLLADYNLLRGRVWALVLLAVFVAPLIAGKLAPRKR